jgi:hypothetical protein
MPTRRPRPSSLRFMTRTHCTARTSSLAMWDHPPSPCFSGRIRARDGVIRIVAGQFA